MCFLVSMKTKTPNESTVLSGFSLEELSLEIARRRAQEMPTDMLSAEQSLHKQHDADCNSAFAAYLIRQSQNETGKPMKCPKCGAFCPVRAKNRRRKIRTLTGVHTFKRNQHYCKSCEYSFYPLDIEMKLPDSGEASPDLERRILDFGVTTTFKEAEDRWLVHYSVPISENFVRRVVERNQQILSSSRLRDVQSVIRTVPIEPAKLLVVQTDGGMVPTRGEEPWKESKLGVIYREDNHASSTENHRGCITEARYVGHLGNVEDFKKHVEAALLAESADNAQEVVWLGDGALWNWNMADELAPAAVQILDSMHVLEHASACAKALFGDNSCLEKLWLDRIKHIIYNESPHLLLLELKGCRVAATQQEKDALDVLTKYYSNNIKRMNYRLFLSKGFPIGSGVVESAHKHVIQKRMKLAGQHWDLQKGRGMVELRAAFKTTGPINFYNAIQILKSRVQEFGKRAA